jgi:hypothetical protein
VAVIVAELACPVIVAALPEQEFALVALPLKVAVIVPALKLPLLSLRTISLLLLLALAVIVAELAWLVIEPAVVAVAALPPILKLAAVPVNPAPLPVNEPTVDIEPELSIEPVNW